METEIADRGYACEDAVVSTEWVALHLDNPTVRIVESTDTPAHGHIPGSVELKLSRMLSGEHADGKEFASVMSNIGVTPDTQLVFCSDNANLDAADTLWICVLFGHTDVKLLDGSRMKWLEEGRELTTAVATYPRSDYDPLPRDDFPNRAQLDEAQQHSMLGNILIDVRSPNEYDRSHMNRAANVFWRSALEPQTKLFKNYDELMNIYGEFGPDEDVIVYGEGGSHTWFVLKFLLGFPNVRYCDAFDPTSFPAR